MRNNLLAFVCFVFLVINAFGQQTDKRELTLKLDISTLKELPARVVIEKTDLGQYFSKSDTVNITKKQLSYTTQLLEAQFLKIVCYWPNKKLTSISFWAVPGVYQLSFNDELKPILLRSNNLDFNRKINQLYNKIAKLRVTADSLVAKVNYENQKIEDVEKKIYAIRDSINNYIDEDIYRVTILNNLNSPLGLYSLCKYSERPYGNQRIKSDPERMEILFNKLAIGIRKLPTAKLFLNKLMLGKQLSLGQQFKHIRLADTLGKLMETGSFKGKYLLIDFWASWCVPCREENPGLIDAFEKYKDLGFHIISVTRDQLAAKDLWLEAIAEDRINVWTQLSDFDNLAQATYAIRFIPSNYLVDPNGVIIGRDLRGEELKNRLEQIFAK